MIEKPLPGDIILYPVTPRSALVSRLVAIGQLLVGAGKGAAQYSHAAVYEKEGWQYEAKWPMSGRFRIDSKRTYEIWRVAGITNEQRVQIMAACRARSGQWYNLIGLLTGGLLGLPHHEVCSQFVGSVYDDAEPAIIFNKGGQRILSPDAMVDDRRMHKLVTVTDFGRQKRYEPSGANPRGGSQ